MGAEGRYESNEVKTSEIGNGEASAEANAQRYYAEDEPHGHPEQTAKSVAETDRPAWQIIGMGIEHFPFQSERLGTKACLDREALYDP
jgi:hypothetical protein